MDSQDKEMEDLTSIAGGRQGGHSVKRVSGLRKPSDVGRKNSVSSAKSSRSATSDESSKPAKGKNESKNLFVVEE